MATKKNISFHAGSTWELPFTITDSAGDPIPLDGQTDVLFRISNEKGTTHYLTLRLSLDEMEIVDADTGAGKIFVSPAQQVTATTKEGKTYRYELKAVRTGSPAFETIQAIGNLAVLDSLFTP